MLEDFYSEFHTFFFARLRAQGLREACRPPANPTPVTGQAAWGEHCDSEPQHSQNLATEDALLCRETFLTVADDPGDGEGSTAEGEVWGAGVQGWSPRPEEDLALEREDPSAGFKRKCPAEKERRDLGKVPRFTPPTSRSASPLQDPGRQPICRTRSASLDLLVPDSDYMEEAEESKSKWDHFRRSPQARCLSPPHQHPTRKERGIRSRSPLISTVAERANDTRARLVPRAREEGVALILKTDLLDAPNTSRPMFCQENEVVIGGCATRSFPRPLGEMEDQVVIDYWFPEE